MSVFRAPKNGFTIVELLIVIVVLSVLVTLVVIGYVGVQGRAYEVSVRQDLGTIAKQVEMYRVELGRYPTVSDMDVLKIRVNKSAYGVNPVGATGFYCVNVDGSAFSIVTRIKSALIIQYNSIAAQTIPYAGSQTAPQLCTDSGVPTTTYLAFTHDGVWNSWIDN